MEESLEDKLSKFDADSPPDNQVNIEAAKARGLTYDTDKEAYVDSDGCLIRDRYGQRF